MQSYGYNHNTFGMLGLSLGVVKPVLVRGEITKQENPKTSENNF